MAIKRYKPYTPSRRHMTVSAFDEITKSTPEKSLVVEITRVKSQFVTKAAALRSNTDW